MLTATTVAEAPPPADGVAGGVHVTTILNVAVLQLEHPDDAPAAPGAPASGARAASGPLIVDGIVLPGLRFGS